MFEGIINGLFHALEGWNLLLIIFGTFLGIVFGSMPGLTATMGLALLVPFTFGMEPAAGLIMLAGIYVGAMYADAIPAIGSEREGSASVSYCSICVFYRQCNC